MICNKYIYDFWKTVFYFCTFCSTITCGNVNYDYMPETFATWEEQINNFTFDEKKQRSCWVKQGRTSASFLSFKISDTFQ